MPDVKELAIGAATTNVTVTTTTETEAVQSGRIAVPSQRVRAIIVAIINLDSGAGTTAVTPRIRRGTTTSGTLVSEAIAHETTAAEAATWVVAAEEELTDLGHVEYIASVEQAGASGNGTVNNALILVFLT